MAKRLGRSIIEPIIVVLALVAYFIIHGYHNLIPANYYPIAPIFVLGLALGVALIYIISTLILLYGEYTHNQKESSETAHIFRLIFYPLLGLALLQSLNISIASLLVGAGFLGIVVGLAAQTTLGNIFSGLSLMYSRPFNVGDKITFSPMDFSVQAPTYPHGPMTIDITGIVKSIGLIYTRIIQEDMSIIYIPNSSLNQGFIENHSRVSEKLIRVRLGVERDTDFELFRKIFIEKIRTNKKDFEKLRNLEIKISLISEKSNLGITITARVKMLEYDKLSQWIAEKAVKSLLEVERKKKK